MDVTSFRSRSPEETQQFGALPDGLLNDEDFAAQGKAVIDHLGCRSLSIGTWRRVAKDALDLVVFCASSKARMTYHINNESSRYKIEYPFSSIKSIRSSTSGTDTTTDEFLSQTGRSTIELHRPPEFFMYSLKPSGFHRCNDFTRDQQASKILIHHLGGVPDVLDRQLAKLTSLESFQKRHDSYYLDADLRTRNVGTGPQYEATDQYCIGTEMPDSDREMWDFLPGFEHLRHQQNTFFLEQAHVDQDSDGDRTTQAPRYWKGNDSGFPPLVVPTSPLLGAPAMSNPAMQVFASLPTDSPGNSEERDDLPWTMKPDATNAPSNTPQGTEVPGAWP
jgi:hypothetical protein